MHVLFIFIMIFIFLVWEGWQVTKGNVQKSEEKRLVTFFFFFQICKISFPFYLNASFGLPNPDLVKSLAMNTSLEIICAVSVPESKEQKEGKGWLCRTRKGTPVAVRSGAGLASVFHQSRFRNHSSPRIAHGPLAQVTVKCGAIHWFNRCSWSVWSSTKCERVAFCELVRYSHCLAATGSLRAWRPRDNETRSSAPCSLLALKEVQGTWHQEGTKDGWI